MSVYPQLQVENPTDSVAQGIAPAGPNFFLPVEIDHEFGKIRLVGEVGYQYFRAQENEWVVGTTGFAAGVRRARTDGRSAQLQRETF